MIGTLVREDLQGLAPVFRKHEQCDECDVSHERLYYHLALTYKMLQRGVIRPFIPKIFCHADMNSLPREVVSHFYR
jgi:hypothetical protein